MSADAGRLSEPQKQVLAKLASGKRLITWRGLRNAVHLDWKDRLERRPTWSTVMSLLAKGLVVQEGQTVGAKSASIILTDAGRRVAEGGGP